MQELALTGVLAVHGGLYAATLADLDAPGKDTDFVTPHQGAQRNRPTILVSALGAGGYEAMFTVAVAR